jgi:hypothetical protein
MSQQEPIVNRVANSSLVSLDLKDFYSEGERVVLDIKNILFQELILREKDFRDYVKQHDWSQYQDKYVALTCSADAIVPVWAYMTIASKIEPYAKKVVFGNVDDLERSLFQENLNKLNLDQFKEVKLVIKGCSDIPVPEFAFVEITRLLTPIASSIMFGEPCSTVPVYKKKKTKKD